jgi:excisionase family DNA binding protein
MHGHESSTSIRKADNPSIAIPGSASLPSIHPILTVAEVAVELRCSKAHVHNLINGKVRGAKPLPSVRMGRRRLVRRTTLEEWIKTNERCYDPIIASH